jgi:hypothetical protein
VDRTAIFVRPKAPEPERYLTSLDDARLHWVALQPLDSDAESFRNAGAEGLLSHEARAGQPLLLLEAYARAADLISRRGSPRTDAEHRLVASLPETSIPSVLIASVRDDMSPEPPESYVREPPPYVDSLIVGDDASPRMECSYLLGPPDSRLGRWAAARGNFVGAAKPWPCEPLEIFEPRLKSLCVPRCLNRAPELDAVGRASCRVIARTDDPRCPEGLGWLDPLDLETQRREPVDDDNGRRHCEIRQLEGAALESCRLSLGCEACEPGWCWTELSELRVDCGIGVYPSFRFVHGPEPSAVTITCNGAR